MLPWLQSTVVRWVAERLVEALVAQLMITLGAKRQAVPAPQLVLKEGETMLCRACGRLLQEDAPLAAKRRSRPASRRADGRPVSRRPRTRRSVPQAR